MNKPTIIIYMEGGHSDDADLTAGFEEDNTNLRDSIANFIQRALPDCIIPGYKIRVQVCGGRNQAIKRFADGVEKQVTDEQRQGRAANVVRVLVVDSEGAVGKGRDGKAHLNRQTGALLGQNVKESRVFLMVQCMEAWFLADADALERFYHRLGYRFDKVVLADEILKAKAGDTSPNIEPIPKSKKGIVHNGVRVGNIPAFIISKAIQGRDYRKSDGFRLFGFIDPDKAIAGSPHCEDFVNAMRTLLCLCLFNP